MHDPDVEVIREKPTSSAEGGRFVSMTPKELHNALADLEGLCLAGGLDAEQIATVYEERCIIISDD